MSLLPPMIVSSESGGDDNPDNHPGKVPMTEREWAIQTRAGLLQQKKALQEQVRGLGVIISAIEKKYNIKNEHHTDICKCNPPIPYDDNPLMCSLCTSRIGTVTGL